MKIGMMLMAASPQKGIYEPPLSRRRPMKNEETPVTKTTLVWKDEL